MDTLGLEYRHFDFSARDTFAPTASIRTFTADDVCALVIKLQSKTLFFFQSCTIESYINNQNYIFIKQIE
jgi:hypothetical protein